MKEVCLAVASVFAATAAFAETASFDSDTAGSLPLAWQQGVTGRGTARWAVVQDESAPSKPKNNVSLYYTQRGKRITLKYVDAPVPPKGRVRSACGPRRTA